MKQAFLVLSFLVAALGFVGQCIADDAQTTGSIASTTDKTSLARGPLDPPVFQVGDSCTYSQKEWDKETYPYIAQVSSVSPEKVVIKLIRADNNREFGDTWLTPEGNLIARRVNSHRIYSVPFKEFFRFPITSESRSVEYSENGENKMLGKFTTSYSLTASFLGVETVSVPAGAIEAIGVRLTGTYDTDPEDRSLKVFYNLFTSFNEEIWYSTRLACVVKRTSYTSWGTGMRNARFNTYVRELTSFRRQGSVTSPEAKK